MPNWCSNHIEVRGTNKRKIQRLVRAFDKKRFCETVVPVPKDVDAYNFCVQNWGTKWDVHPYEPAEVHDDGYGFSGSFDTAWSPPIAILEALTAQGFYVVLRYHEQGMAFVGKWDDGFDEYYEYNGLDSRQVRGAIGDDLDDFFGITDIVADQEDEEDVTRWIREGVEARENV